jgi:hypothetical protein
MDTTRYLEMVMGKRGQFITLCWQRTVKTAAAFKHLTIEKKTTVTARTGVEYDNIKAVQEKRESGELPAENAGLPFGEWTVYPYVIRHNGQDYARIYTAKNAIPNCEWYMDGKRIDRAQGLSFLTPSDRKRAEEKSSLDCFTVKMNDVIKL